jgi:hypothetical protein
MNKCLKCWFHINNVKPFCSMCEHNDKVTKADDQDLNESQCNE